MTAPPSAPRTYVKHRIARTYVRSRRGAVVCACAGAALAGCGGVDGAQGELTVAAASSLTEAFEAYGETTGADERFSFAGSGELAAQIRQGAPVDVFAAADTELPEALFGEGLAAEPVVFIANQLVLAVPVGSEIDDLAALEGDLDLVIGAEGVPVGDYTREVLGNLPRAGADAILANVRSEEPDVKGIVGKLVAGAADAGFVYASDAAAAGDELRAIELPGDLAPVVEYGVAVVSDSDNADTAEEFVAGLLDGDGRDALLDAGFLEPGSTGGRQP